MDIIYALPSRLRSPSTELSGSGSSARAANDMYASSWTSLKSVTGLEEQSAAVYHGLDPSLCAHCGFRRIQFVFVIESCIPMLLQCNHIRLERWHGKCWIVIVYRKSELYINPMRKVNPCQEDSYRGCPSKPYSILRTETVAATSTSSGGPEIELL